MPPLEDGTRQRILDAAGAVFADAGFEKATIREISSRAEVNLAAINYHFGDKERLYQETLRQAQERALAEAPVPEWLPGTPPTQKLREFIRALAQRMLLAHQQPWHTQLMLREIVQPTGLCRDVLRGHVQPQHALMLEIFSELAPAGVSKERLHQLAFSVVGQCLFYKLGGPIVRLLVDDEQAARLLDPARLSAHISDVMLSALGVPIDFSSSDSSLKQP